MEAAKERLTRARVESEKMEETEAFVISEQGAVAAQEEQLSELAVLEKAYGRDGIPAMIVETVAIPEIEREASRILSELGTDYRVELRSVRELKGGGHADALDIAVIVGGATIRPYETFQRRRAHSNQSGPPYRTGASSGSTLWRLAAARHRRALLSR